MVRVEAMASERVPPDSLLNVEVVVGVAPGQVLRVPLQLPLGSTVQDAVQASGVLGTVKGLDLTSLADGRWSVGVWGRRERPSHALRDRDRIELVRGLIVDPKEARRVRHRSNKPIKKTIGQRLNKPPRD